MEGYTVNRESYLFQDGIFRLTDDEICTLVEEKVIPFYQLETALNNFSRAVNIRLVCQWMLNTNSLITKHYSHNIPFYDHPVNTDEREIGLYWAY